MDYKTIEDEVYDFNAGYFDEISAVVEDNLDFIEGNNLYMPKENYSILNQFLQKTYKNFKILDPHFFSSTLDKLSNDLNNINQLHDSVKKNSANITEVFNSSFVPKSNTLKNFAKAIHDFSEEADKTSENMDYLKRMKTDYIKLKKIFYGVFEEIFYEDKKNYLLDLKTSINVKSYYFDSLLWKEASGSIILVKHFQIRKLIGKLNSKDYILFTTSMMRPYTDEYRYLQKCLKVFK